MPIAEQPFQNIPDYLKGLNDRQLEAVKHPGGALLILAGAGTGKTKVLIAKMAHLILQERVYPSNILAVTFTNKAAKEMRHRLQGILEVSGLWLGTFHALAAKILRAHPEMAGLQNSNFNIIDSDDQLRLIKAIARENYVDEKRFTPKAILNVIQKWKDIALVPEKVSSNDLTSPLHQTALKIYVIYQNRLRTQSAVDFGDLLLHNITIFSKYPEVLVQYQKKFRYLLVDEYQDTNVAQYIWLRLLAAGHKNICCVGDEDQSIYGWRGAEIGNILRFEQDFPTAKVIKLEQNYRSTGNILASASALIANNNQRLGKTLWTDEGEGAKVSVSSCVDERAEASQIAMEIYSLKRNQQQNLNEFAILVRAGFQTRAFEECFVANALPYKVIGGLRFYERLEIRDLIAYIRVSMQPDDDLALMRIINTPKRAIGEVCLATIRSKADALNISLFRAIEEMLQAKELKSGALKSLTQLITCFKSWSKLFEIKHHAQVTETIASESGYLAMWRSDKSPEAEGRVENILELIRALEEFDDITSFLEHVSLVSDREANVENMVSIMTLHAAKGMEFNTVFLPGWEEGVFPHPKSLEEKGANGLEEERRLAYVGITRARRNLYISYAASRRIYNQWQNNIASRFISELPVEVQ